jgi:hypothetical protein
MPLKNVARVVLQTHALDERVVATVAHDVVGVVAAQVLQVALNEIDLAVGEAGDNMCATSLLQRAMPTLGTSYMPVPVTRCSRAVQSAWRQKAASPPW